MGGPGSGRKPGKKVNRDRLLHPSQLKVLKEKAAAIERRLLARDKAAAADAKKYLRLSRDDRRSWVLFTLACEARRIGEGASATGRVQAVALLARLEGFDAEAISAPALEVLDIATEDATPAELAAQLDALCEGG
jgi:hypothetical protein